MILIYKAHLEYRYGSSDKEYNVRIIQNQNGQIDVEASWGHRGNPGAWATKSQTSSLPVAEVIAKNLVISKKNRGYSVITEYHSQTSPDADLTNPQTSISLSTIPEPKERSPHLPQLLNPVDSLEGTGLRSDDRYWQQQKMDGDRRAIEITHGKVRGINRLGFYVPINDDITHSAMNILPQTLIDGEIVEGILYVFDLLIYNGQDLRHQPYYVRLQMLEALVPTFGSSIKIVPTARTTEEKERAFSSGAIAGVEGFVYKLKNAPYTPGRPNSGGPQLKLKFWKSASVVVTGLNTKNSFTMGVYDQRQDLVSIGNCTGKSDIPLAVGDVVEVKYLYYQSALVQPELIKKRQDILAEDCALDQLVEPGEKSTVNYA